MRSIFDEDYCDERKRDRESSESDNTKHSLIDDDFGFNKRRRERELSERRENKHSLFDNDCGCTKREKDHCNTKCEGCVCGLLSRLENKDDHHPRQKLLILNKGTSQPVSVDGMDPTIFTLKRFNRETCCAEFSFDNQLMDSATGSTPVTGTLIEDCRSIAGIFRIEDDHDS
ncbi:hypothetical protein [Scopulibacillus cellulosilyticus]|uniref:Spore coat protein Z n=1 Tax=Scopulibacillus cellulosilyticus TaxID=2665665 RepID=A0ABW2Q1C4_9BACL